MRDNCELLGRGSFMITYIAFLRGINVGKQNRIKMSDVKQMFVSLGLCQVQTYIQSGNVVFQSDQEETALGQRLEEEFAKVFGFSVIIILRSLTELENVSRNCPFSAEAIAEADALASAESLYVAFLQQAPSEDKLLRINPFSGENDQFRIDGRNVFLLFQHSIRDSKLANHLHKLEVPMTVRNWKTINKLLELAYLSNS